MKQTLVLIAVLFGAVCSMDAAPATMRVFQGVWKGQRTEVVRGRSYQAVQTSTNRVYGGSGLIARHSVLVAGQVANGFTIFNPDGTYFGRFSFRGRVIGESEGTWTRVGRTIQFSGTSEDATNGTYPVSATIRAVGTQALVTSSTLGISGGSRIVIRQQRIK